MKKLVSTLNMEKAEWLKYRKQGIGGSDAGAVCRFNPYRTALQVYQDKTTDETEESTMKQCAKGGNLRIM
jgi:predicted phage-related endonuclease